MALGAWPADLGFTVAVDAGSLKIAFGDLLQELPPRAPSSHDSDKRLGSQDNKHIADRDSSHQTRGCAASSWLRPYRRSRELPSCSFVGPHNLNEVLEAEIVNASPIARCCLQARKLTSCLQVRKHLPCLALSCPHLLHFTWPHLTCSNAVRAAAAAAQHPDKQNSAPEQARGSTMKLAVGVVPPLAS